MAAWTLDEAKAKLSNWLKAEDAVALGQSMTMGDRVLTRVNADMITKKIAFWRNEVDRLEKAESELSPFQTVRTRFI